MVKHILPGGEKTRKHLVVANCFSPAIVGCIDLTWQHICKISVPCLLQQGMQIEMCDLRFGVCGFAGHNSRSSVLLAQVLLGSGLMRQVPTTRCNRQKAANKATRCCRRYTALRNTTRWRRYTPPYKTERTSLPT